MEKGKKRFPMSLHAKFMVVDEGFYIGGSMNWTDNSAENMVESVRATQFATTVAWHVHFHRQLAAEAHRPTLSDLPRH